MTLRWWYLRRGVPWLAVLGCCAAAGLLAGVLAQWPSAAIVLLPGILACCAAAATFVYDERPVLLVAVTPRGDTWRRTARLAVALVPLALWSAIVLARPGDLPLHRGGWLLLGLAAVSLSVGAAALASRLEVPAPGAMIAPVVALAAIAPVVVAAFLGWESVYPIGDFPRGVWVFWSLVGCGAALVAFPALGSGVRASARPPGVGQFRRRGARPRIPPPPATRRTARDCAPGHRS